MTEEATEILIEESAAPNGKKLQVIRSVWKGKSSLVLRAYTSKGLPVNVRVNPRDFAMVQRALLALGASPVAAMDGGEVVFSRGPQWGKVTP